MEKIILYHAALYPLMQPEDAVKLIYQNEFGIGHLISDPDLFYERLLKEAESVPVTAGIPLTEPIGNGMVRVMLNSPERSAFSLESLAEACLRTAKEHQGSMQRFLMKIRELQTACKAGLFQFSENTLNNYLTGYRAEGCPPVSHSLIYHEAYHPAYRVIKEDLLFPSGQISPKTSR